MRHAATVIDRVRQLAEENPKAKYKPPSGSEACYYDAGTAAGHTGCIMGQAIKGYIRLPKRHYRGSIASLLTKAPDVKASVPEIRWLTIVQERQDRGVPWREAVASADRQAGLEGWK